jgi:cytochrome c oxidase subunit 2
MFWTVTIVFVIVVAAAVGAVLRRGARTRLPVTPDSMIDVGREHRMTVVVCAAVGVTALILIVFLSASAWTGRKLAELVGRDPVTIEVTGHQWWWEVQYDAPTPAGRVTTANEIHVPVGRRVLLKLESRDVIHSFWVPRLHGKMDLIPGQTNLLWIQADQAGRYPGQCAEFCGYQHAHMRLLIIAEPAEQFDAWLVGQRRSAAEPSNPLAARGRDVFLGGPCVLCHTIRGTDAGSRVGPDLTHLASRTTLAAGTLPNTPGHLAGWIVDAQGVKPGVRMPSISLPAEELQAMLAYLGSLK